MKNLRSLAYKFELDQSELKSSQAIASHVQTESQVNSSFQLALTCDSVWPGINFFSFIDNTRDDLEEIRTEIGNVSEKLDTLKTSATEDEGQFLEIIKRLKLDKKIFPDAIVC